MCVYVCVCGRWKIIFKLFEKSKNRWTRSKDIDPRDRRCPSPWLRRSFVDRYARASRGLVKYDPIKGHFGARERKRREEYLVHCSRKWNDHACKIHSSSSSSCFLFLLFSLFLFLFSFFYFRLISSRALKWSSQGSTYI